MSAIAEAITNVEGSRPRLFSALATAERNTLVMGPWSHGGWHGGEGSSLGPVNDHILAAESDTATRRVLEEIARGNDPATALGGWRAGVLADRLRAAV